MPLQTRPSTASGLSEQDEELVRSFGATCHLPQPRLVAHARAQAEHRAARDAALRARLGGVIAASGGESYASVAAAADGAAETIARLAAER